MTTDILQQISSRLPQDVLGYIYEFIPKQLYEIYCCINDFPGDFDYQFHLNCTAKRIDEILQNTDDIISLYRSHFNPQTKIRTTKDLIIFNQCAFYPKDGFMTLYERKWINQFCTEFHKDGITWYKK